MITRTATAAAALIACLVLVSGAASAETKPFVRGSWAELRQTHAGRPMIVHIWGLSCGPCLVELPDWAKFIQSHPGADLVLVNGDKPDGKPGPAEQRVAKAGLGAAESWSFAEAHVDRLRFEIDPGWQGELPYTLLVARDGTVTSFSGSANFAELATWLDRQRH